MTVRFRVSQVHPGPGFDLVSLVAEHGDTYGHIEVKTAEVGKFKAGDDCDVTFAAPGEAVETFQAPAEVPGAPKVKPRMGRRK